MFFTKRSSTMKAILKSIALAALFIVFILFPLMTQEIDNELWDKAKKIHEEAIVIDAHAHVHMFDHSSEKLDIGKDSAVSQIDLIKMRKGNMDAAFYSMALASNRDRENPLKAILNSVEIIKKQINKYPELAGLVLTHEDVVRLSNQRKRAILLSIESAHSLEGQIDRLETYYKSGIRSVIIAHDKEERIAESESDDAGDSGLSDYGRKVIKEMNRLGILIDITHMTDRLQKETIEESKAPVIASHSCMRSIHNKSRNMPDEILKMLAKKGGVVAITFSSSHLSKEYTDKLNDARERFKPIREELELKYKDDKEALDKAVNEAWEKYVPEAVDITVLIDHIEHAVKIAGVDHVGIGSDYGGRRYSYPKELKDATGFPLITYHLIKRGYSEEDIKKVMGGNIVRLLEQVEKQAKAIRSR
jgi:membrane dipeptidase